MKAVSIGLVATVLIAVVAFMVSRQSNARHELDEAIAAAHNEQADTVTCADFVRNGWDSRRLHRVRIHVVLSDVTQIRDAQGWDVAWGCEPASAAAGVIRYGERPEGAAIGSALDVVATVLASNANTGIQLVDVAAVDTDPPRN